MGATSRRLVNRTTAFMKAILALEDGRIFKGQSFGVSGSCVGEVVFNTSMTGYQEILTDPSYKGQIVTMTYPLIGNYGVNKEDIESSKSHVEGFVVRENSLLPSNWRTGGDLAGYLKKNRIIAVEGIDTRALTKHIRLAGSMRAVISTRKERVSALVKRARAWRGLVNVDTVKEVTCRKSYKWCEGIKDEYWPPLGGKVGARTTSPELRATNKRFKVVVYDFGVKYNILRMLYSSGCDPEVVPAATPAEKVLAKKPHGVFLSNGPGDPAGVPYAAAEVAKLVGQVPMFGICFGHQITGLALGGKTFKLKFGHRGANQPVKDLKKGNVLITSQNHNYCVDIESLPGKEVEPYQINLNDNTVEGIRHKRYPIFSVQYHPEASPGPRDGMYLFLEFRKMMEKFWGNKRVKRKAVQRRNVKRLT